MAAQKPQKFCNKNGIDTVGEANMLIGWKTAQAKSATAGRPAIELGTGRDEQKDDQLENDC